MSPQVLWKEFIVLVNINLIYDLQWIGVINNSALELRNYHDKFRIWDCKEPRYYESISVCWDSLLGYHFIEVNSFVFKVDSDVQNG